MCIAEVLYFYFCRIFSQLEVCRFFSFFDEGLFYFERILFVQMTDEFLRWGLINLDSFVF